LKQDVELHHEIPIELWDSSLAELAINNPDNISYIPEKFLTTETLPCGMKIFLKGF
jgi:hypothetical protein